MQDNNTKHNSQISDVTGAMKFELESLEKSIMVLKEKLHSISRYHEIEKICTSEKETAVRKLVPLAEELNNDNLHIIRLRNEISKITELIEL